MIRIHRCLPRHEQQRPAAVQTDQIFPRITRCARKYEDRAGCPAIAVNSSCADGTANCKEKLQHDRKGERTPFATFHEHKQSPLSNLIGKGGKAQCQFSPKIEAKCFKFLRFQENILRLALTKYLAAIPLSKEQTKKMNQKIVLTYLLPYQASPDCNSSSPLGSCIQIDSSDSSQMRVTIREIVDQLRKIHVQANQVEEKDGVLAAGERRKVGKMVETLIKQSKTLQMSLTVSETSDNATKLKEYLQKYAQEFQQHESVHKDQNVALMKFYQTVFNRYQQVPFNDQFKTTPIHLSQTFTRDKNRRKVTKKQTQATVSVEKQTRPEQQSFIKLRFYNNLRQQVKNLTEDTQKIINAEMNKLSQI